MASSRARPRGNRCPVLCCSPQAGQVLAMCGRLGEAAGVQAVLLLRWARNTLCSAAPPAQYVIARYAEWTGSKTYSDLVRRISCCVMVCIYTRTTWPVMAESWLHPQHFGCRCVELQAAATPPLLPADDQVQTRCRCPHVQVRKMLGKKAALLMSLGLLFYTYGSGRLVFGGMLGGSTLQWRPCLPLGCLQHCRRGVHRLPKNRVALWFPHTSHPGL